MIDICVLTAGRFDLLDKCLDAIGKEVKNTPCKVYIFDNGSPTDERLKHADIFTKPFITSHKRKDTNIGFPAGANTAIKMGNSEYVLFISDDIILYPGAVDSLYKTLKNNPKIGLCGLKLLFANDSTDPARPAGKVQHVGHAVDIRGNIIHPFIGWSASNPKCCVSGERFSVTGATFMMPRHVFNKVRGFNIDYKLGYFEDVEMALNIAALGYKIWVDTNAIAEHYVGATFTVRKEQATIQENQQKFLAKNRQLLRWTDWELR